MRTYSRRAAHICEGDERCIYYHATFADNEIPILLEGLRTCKPRVWSDYSCRNYNYVASKPETALRWVVAYHITNELIPDDGAVIFEVDVSGMEITINTPWNVFVYGDILPERVKLYKRVDIGEMQESVGKILNNVAYWTKCGLEETIYNILRE